MSGKPRLFTETPLFRDTYNISLELFKLTTKFSKQFKYTLGQRIIDHFLDLIDLLYKSNSCKDKNDKLFHIEKFINTHELLKVHVRLSEELGAIPRSSLTKIHLSLDNIGKQIHGLKRYTTSDK